jgi:hypothetical protein
MSEKFSNDVNYDNIKVEDVTGDIDLDTLLGGDFLSSNDLPPTENETVIEEPHFRVSVKDFVEVLKLSTLISETSGADVLAKAIGLEVVDGRLKVYLTDYNRCILTDINVTTSGEMLTDYIVVILPIISKILQTCDSSMTIFKKDGKYFAKVIGATVILETVQFPKENLLDKVPKYSDLGTLPTIEFRDVAKNLYGVVSSAVSSNQRRMFLSDRKLITQSQYSIVRYDCSYDLPEIEIPLRELKIIYLLALRINPNEVVIKKSKGRMQFIFGNSSFSYDLSIYEPQKSLLSLMDTLLEGESVEVKHLNLKKMVEFSYGLSYSTTKIDFNYTEDGDISCVVRTKRDDTIFLLEGKPNPNATPLEKSVSIPAGLLRTVVNVFSKFPTVNICLSPNGISLVNGNYKSVIYNERE